MRSLTLVMIAAACFLIVPTGAAGDAKCPLINYPLITGNEEVNAPVVFPPYALPPQVDAVDLVGDTVVIGTTWYESQHNGTIGRMLEKDELEYLHFVWMNGTNIQATDRHVYYNFIDPSGIQGWPGTGYQVESSQRAGYTTLDVDYGGKAFPAFHEQITGTQNSHTAVATDFFPHSGAFLIYEPPWIYQGGTDLEVIWPKIQFDRNQVIHLVATENVAVVATPQRQYYITGIYDPETWDIEFDEEWTLVDYTMTVAADIATSDVSDRIAVGWTYCKDDGFPGGTSFSQRNNDIHILIDEDGVDPNFEEAFNLTDFIPPDLSWLPDTLRANMDTLRAYTDMCLFFDQDDWLHVAFTTPSYFAIDELYYWHPSIVWHWSEQFPDEFRIVHNAFNDWWWNFIDCGAWNVKAQRPSLGQDPLTGYLYCMYQVYDCDTLALSSAGYPSGEVYISVSTDGGRNWAVGTNVTSTITPTNAPPGHCFSELTPSMAKVVDGECHIMYVLDLDAGFAVQMEGSWTLNPVIYHRVPVEQIPTMPFVPQDVPFHVEHAYTGPDVSVELTPFITSIVIPASGGSFEFYAFATNNEATPQDMDLWSEAIRPGSTFGPLMGPAALTLEPGTTNWYRVQNVPGNAPAGSYTYVGYAGIYPDEIWAFDYIEFEKLETGEGPWVGDWYNWGDPIGDEGIAANVDLPKTFALYPAYPNPFNPVTTLSFDLPEDTKVSLKIYNLQGRLVATLVDGIREAGTHEVAFVASHLASGIYIYRLKAGEFSASGKLIMIK